MQGVTVIICCYNSAARIKDTLSALAIQRFHSDVAWEIVLVDNASGDHTAAQSRRIWDSFDTGIRLRIVHESLPGQMNARRKGIAEARYSILLFCDDDNWLSPEYVQGVVDVLTADPDIAACGGRGIPVFETAKPAWFDEFAEAFATGSQELNRENGRIISLYGAGLAIRKHALDEVLRSGTMLTGGRTGKSLGSADDIELTYSLVLKGYRLVYVPGLTFRHYLPKERLTRAYLTGLFSSFGKDGPIRNLYYAHLTESRWHRKIVNWYYHLLLSLVRTGKYLIVPPKRSSRGLYFRWNLAYLGKLLKIKPDYERLLNHISLLRGKAPRPGMDKPVHPDYEEILH
ncbi:MAG TPA: glycosyltransferase [Puia sp.]|nr:glycosyltransferase [Puia sp.]